MYMLHLHCNSALHKSKLHWYLHFYGIKSEFMGMYIQNSLDLDSACLG